MNKPRVGFLGVGWIGRNRMEAMLETGLIEATAVFDPSPECLAEAMRHAPGIRAAADFEELLDLDLDGIVIATPSALHAEQAIRALEAGAAVFCQKPLGRNAAEAEAVVDAARSADRLLAVDFSYRFATGMDQIAALVREGELGRLHAIDLVFHNAYGPDKEWFYDPARSGGGCIMDLGVHLIDLALWTTGFPEIRHVSSHYSAGGEPIGPASGRVEDYAVASLLLDGGIMVRMTCSWRLHAGCDAVIAASFYGTQGGARLGNIDGSFLDLVAERNHGTRCTRLAGAPDSWSGRAAAHWAEALARDNRFDSEAENLVLVARTLDRIYQTGR